MAAAGHRAEQARQKAVDELRGQYLVIVEGSIPTGANGAYCTIGGRSALDIAREVCGGAAATIAIGTCAAFGGIPAAAPNPTQALSVADAVPGLKNLINLPACPRTGRTWRRWSSTTSPSSAGRRSITTGGRCSPTANRSTTPANGAHYDAGQYVEEWGDLAHRDGQCLYKMGCRAR